MNHDQIIPTHDDVRRARCAREERENANAHALLTRVKSALADHVERPYGSGTLETLKWTAKYTTEATDSADNGGRVFHRDIPSGYEGTLTTERYI